MSPPSDHPTQGRNQPPITRFIFDTNAGQAARKDLELQENAIEARLSRIIERVQVGGNPILLPLIHMTKGDRTELANLGRALQRVAEILPELDEVRRRLAIVRLAEDDPAWLASVFGDFSADINAITESYRHADVEGDDPE